MKKTDRDRIVRVEEALVSAHRRRPEFDPGPALRERIMRSVRNVGLETAAAPDSNWTPTVWRFAAATCALAVVLLLYAAGSGIGEYEAAGMLVDDSAVLDVSRSFGLW